MPMKLFALNRSKVILTYCNLRWISSKHLQYSMVKHHNYPKHPHKADDQALIRNIGVMAHIDAGKTTTTERMLYYSGFSTHLGDVDHGDTIMDYMDQERERGITVNSAAITFHWKHHKINLIDTPGHVDFTFEVERSLRALDGAVAVLDASAGVEAQTVTVWRQANRYSVPRIIYINKMDKLGADVDLCLKSIRAKLRAVPLLLHLPIGTEKDFQGIIDLVTMETAIWSKGNTGDGREFQSAPINQSKNTSVWTKAMDARTLLIGQLADLDNEIAELFLNDTPSEKIPMPVLLAALKRVTLKQKAVPVLIGSSLKNKGVQFLLDGITHFLPSPVDFTNPWSDFYKEDLCALVFKITHEKQRGAMTYLRLYSGSLKAGANVFNVTRDKTERVGHLLQIYADTHRDINHIDAGNIVCVTGLKETITGDIITNNKTSHEKALENFRKSHSKDLPSGQGEVTDPFSGHLSVPNPVFFCAIEPQSMSVQKDLEDCLANLQREDNSLRVGVDKDTGQTILSGMGELHLEIIKDRIQKEYGIEVELGPLQVAYRETITDSAKITETLDKTIGDRRHVVSMTISVQPEESSTLFKNIELAHSRENNLEAIRRQDVQAINSGISLGLSNGPILNFAVYGVKVYLHNFETHPGTSMAMKSACATTAIHNALKAACPVLMEPMMHLEYNKASIAMAKIIVEEYKLLQSKLARPLTQRPVIAYKKNKSLKDILITSDEDYVHVILSDLARRRSHINNIAANENVRIISAKTPLAEMVGYATDLRTITSGTAVFSMELDQYEALNPAEQNKAIEKVTGFLPA